MTIESKHCKHIHEVTMSRCGVCKNCQVVERTKDRALRFLSDPTRLRALGDSDEIVRIWNDTIRDFPCTNEVADEANKPAY